MTGIRLVRLDFHFEHDARVWPCRTMLYKVTERPDWVRYLFGFLALWPETCTATVQGPETHGEVPELASWIMFSTEKTERDQTKMEMEAQVIERAGRKVRGQRKTIRSYRIRNIESSDAGLAWRGSS